MSHVSFYTRFASSSPKARIRVDCHALLYLLAIFIIKLLLYHYYSYQIFTVLTYKESSHGQIMTTWNKIKGPHKNRKVQ